jgi:hypothetical protein
MDKTPRQPGMLSRMIQKPRRVSLNRREDRSRPSETLKAAVMAALITGLPSSQIALRFGLPPSTVRRWEEEFNISNPVQREGRLGELITIFVEQEISSLMTISMVTQDEEWIKEQKASELAVYVATKQDRVMRILEAFGEVSSPPSVQTIEGEVRG